MAGDQRAPQSPIEGVSVLEAPQASGRARPVRLAGESRPMRLWFGPARPELSPRVLFRLELIGDPGEARSVDHGAV
jgi:hypothetical protein